MAKRVYENKFARFWIEHNILFITYRSNVFINLAAAKEIVKDRLVFQRDKEYPVLCELPPIQGSDYSAREYLAQEGTILLKAIAFYAPPPLAYWLIDFYLKTHNHGIPTKFFPHRNQAKKFLNNYN